MWIGHRMESLHLMAQQFIAAENYVKAPSSQQPPGQTLTSAPHHSRLGMLCLLVTEASGCWAFTPQPQQHTHGLVCSWHVLHKTYNKPTQLVQIIPPVLHFYCTIQDGPELSSMDHAGSFWL